MIYSTPAIDGDLRARLEELDALRRQLGDEVARPTRWMGSLRRAVRASAILGSTSIEGFSVDPSEARAMIEGGVPPDSGDDDALAVSDYARAMDHVGVMAADPAFQWSERVILDLHFDACHFQRDRDPGLWRKGEIAVTGPGGRIDYRGPDAEWVPALIAEMVAWLNDENSGVDAIVRGAIAHLVLTSIHPFRDGNGRASRIVQSLVLAREGLVSPEFSSIEEYLGAHTGDYYSALREVQGGSYQPDRDTRAWVEFCVDAHLSQAHGRLAQIEAAARRWASLESIVREHGWPERLTIALEQSLFAGSDRGSYGREAGVSPASASNDLRRLLDSGLLTQVGRGRSTRYRASERLRAVVARER